MSGKKEQKKEKNKERKIEIVEYIQKLDIDEDLDKASLELNDTYQTFL